MKVIIYFFFWLFSMVTWPGTSQCCLKAVSTSKTKTTTTKNQPVFHLWAKFHGIVLFSPPRTLANFSSRISNPFWLSVCHQNYHQLSLLPKHLLSPPKGSHIFHRTVLPGFDLDEEVFPMSTQRKLLPLFWHLSWEKLVQCYPCGVLVFSSLIACL